MRLLWFSAVLLLGAVSAAGETLSGTFRDKEGAAIPNAFVLIHWDSSGSKYLKDNTGIRQDVTAKTDSSGRFSVDLPPGFYDVFVTATSFTPYCRKFRVKGT